MLTTGNRRGLALTPAGRATATPFSLPRLTRRPWSVPLVLAGLLATMLFGIVRPLPAQKVAQPVKIAVTVQGGDDGPQETEKAEAGKVMPLVPVDEELEDYLHRAETLVAASQYDEAIEILQSLVTSGAKVFCRPDEKVGRFISLRSVALQKIGALPDEGLALYRQRYDAKAAALLRDAQQSGDETLLRQVVEEYFHTSCGDRAMNLLGAQLMDEGRFLDAARVWDAARNHRGGSMDTALLIAKAATAYHLAGVTDQATERLALLKSKYPQAESPIGGTPTNLVAFVEQVLASAPPAPTDDDAPACDRATLPLWQQPTDSLDGASVLGFPSEARSSKRGGTSPSRPFETRIRRGQVLISTSANNASLCGLATPAMIHPAVAGNLVIYRDLRNIVACDIETGTTAWISHDLPLYSEADIRNQWMPQFVCTGRVPGDAGRFTVTVEDDLVFAVAQIAAPRTSGIPGMAPPMSTLVALSIHDNGRLVWKVGGGNGSTDLAQSAYYLAAPTYQEGRLYTLAQRDQTFYALCLDARTGTVLWETAIGQMGTLATSPWLWSGVPGLSLWFSQGSPPTVTGGRVYVTTNAGLVACLTADQGVPLWNYQYETPTPPNRPPSSITENRTFSYPPNPILVMKGLVIVLPADHDKVVALASDSGEPVWEAERQQQYDLTALDTERLLLSGNSLVVLKGSDGSPLFKASDLEEICGRPVASATSVIASGRGQLWRLDPKTYTLTATSVFETGSLLGNLVVAKNRLVAANAAGVCVYFEQEDAWKVLENLLAAASTSAERFRLRLKRGQFALLGGQLDQAHKEFLAAAAESEAVPELQGDLATWRYRLATRCADLATEDAPQGRFLDEAATVAADPPSKAELLLRQIAYHEKFGRFTKAVQAAQRLSEEFSETPVHPLPPTTPTEGALWPSEDDPTIPGFEAGQHEVARLIATHGRNVYADFDAQAKKVLEQGPAAGDVDALLNAAMQYPHSQWTDRLLLVAAETLYRRATDGPTPDRRMLERTVRVLDQIPPDTPLGREAQVGTALADAQLYPTQAASLHAALGGDRSKTTVRFADFRGSISQAYDLLKSKAKPAVAQPQFTQQLSLPLRETYRVQNPKLILLRGNDGRAARIGPYLFLHDGKQIVCLDTRRDTYESAKVWACDHEEIYANTPPPFAYVTAECDAVMVCSQQSLLLLEASTGKVRYHKTLAEWDSVNWLTATSDGHRLYLLLVNSNLVCVNLADGKIAWRGSANTMPGRMSRITVTGDVVLLQGEDSPSRIRCYDAQTGRMLYQESGTSQRTDAALTPDGLLLLAGMDRIRLLDPYQTENSPLWQWPPSDGSVGYAPLVLGTGHRFAALFCNQSPRTVQMVDLSQGTLTPNPQVCQNPQDNPPLPNTAYFDGNRAYFICGYNGPSRYYRYGRRVANLHVPSLRAVDLDSGEVLWTMDLPLDNSNMWSIEDPILLDDYLVTSGTPMGSEIFGEWFVLSKKTGNLVCSGMEKVGDTRGLDTNLFRWRCNILGGPVVTNGRMVVECPTGIVLLRSPL